MLERFQSRNCSDRYRFDTGRPRLEKTLSHAFFGREPVEAKPRFHIGLKLSVSCYCEPAFLFGPSHRRVAHPNLGQRPQIGR